MIENMYALLAEEQKADATRRLIVRRSSMKAAGVIVMTALTNGWGRYNVNLAGGNWDAEASKAGYITANSNLTVTGPISPSQGADLNLSRSCLRGSTVFCSRIQFGALVIRRPTAKLQPSWGCTAMQIRWRPRCRVVQSNTTISAWTTPPTAVRMSTCVLATMATTRNGSSMGGR